MKSTKIVPISSNKGDLTLYPVLMWACAALFYLYQFVLRVSPSVMTEELQGALSIEGCALGILASFYYYGYSGFQIPVGVMLDRIGVRLPLTAANLLCLVGCFLFISMDNLMVMAVGRFLMGIGSAFGFLSALKIATLWLPAGRYAFFVGLTLLLGTSGAVMAGAPLSFIIGIIGWKETMIILALMSSIIAAITFLTVKDHDSHKRSKDGVRSYEFKIVESIKIVLTNPQFWIIGAYGCLMYVPLSGFADLWGVPYIMAVFNVDKAEAAGSISMLYIGVGVGGPLAAIAADYFKSLNKPMIGGGIVAFIFTILALYGDGIPFYLTYVIFFIVGIGGSVQFLAFSTVTNVNPSSISGTATGLHNMLCMLSGVVVQPLIGYLLDYSSQSNNQSVPGVAYSQNDYKMALMLVPLSILVSIGCAFFIKETYQSDK